MIRNNPDIAAIILLAVFWGAAPQLKLHVRNENPQMRVIQITDRVDRGR